jgi:serine/threonine-protein kinase
LTLRIDSLGKTALDPTRTTLVSPTAAAVDAETLRTVQAIALGQEPPLAVLSTLGEGGMGIVQLGVQRSLGREVALKTLRPGARSDEAVTRLVREAIVTGSLEHPNIVPVYDLSMGEENAPVLVIKRVEGSTWTAHMKNAASVRELSDAADLLEWNLRTLMSVCQAVHFAHSRGVVHRDLKPDNVMVGGFGEVYVVDWGIAVRTGQCAKAEAHTIVGTPAYMAPEMLLGEPISPRTDVFLLGAVLFEILTGRAPHEAEGRIDDLVRSVLDSPPSVPAGAPEELVELVRACMRREPESRLQSADEVRHALGNFLRHRSSAALGCRAEVRRAELERVLASSESPESDRVQRLYGETTFGYRAALEAWPENEAARAGLANAARALIRYDLRQGMAQTARAHLADLLEPDDALRAEIDAAIQSAEEEARRNAALRTELDPRTGRRSRIRLMFLIGASWTLQPLAQHLGLLGRGAESHLAGGLSAIGSAAILVLCMALLRESIFSSRLNRQLARVALFVLVVQAVAYAGAAMLGITAAMTQIQLVFLWFCVTGVLGVMLEPRLLVPAAAFLIAFGVAAVAPHLRLLAESAANAVLTVTAVIAWRDRSDDP